MMQQVYVMEGADRLKIGRSRQLYARKAQHEATINGQLRVVYTTAPDERAADIERVACRLLRNAGHQLSGEWFAVCMEIAVQAVIEAERIVRCGLPEPAVVTRHRQPPSVFHTMRLDEDLKATLQKLADDDNRSLTNYIETVLRQHVADHKRAKK